MCRHDCASRANSTAFSLDTQLRAQAFREAVWKQQNLPRDVVSLRNESAMNGCMANFDQRFNKFPPFFPDETRLLECVKHDP
jgi:hypothetical protein